MRIVVSKPALCSFLGEGKERVRRGRGAERQGNKEKENINLEI